MSTLLYALGRWSYRHPWRVLVAWLLLLGIAGGSAALFMKGTDNSFSIPGTESQAGIEQLSRTFPQASGTSAQIVVVAADGDSGRRRAVLVRDRRHDRLDSKTSTASSPSPTRSARW